ncbi:unnamed protein product [Dicrocoelium dendriticum]|nr:unnamed protein product [Dicrocoelium dendriticum]
MPDPVLTYSYFKANLDFAFRVIRDEQRTILGNWSLHDSLNGMDFYDPDDNEGNGKLIWVDLLENPERFTGYKGAASHRIWHMIHAENCFNDKNFDHQTFVPSPDTLRCLEKRAFHRLLSGLHTSVSVHLCALYPRTLFATGHHSLSSSSSNSADWGPNIPEFHRRFHPDLVPEGLDRLRNLYFAYLVELRALAKAAPYLRKITFYTGDEQVDARTRVAVDDLLGIVESKLNLFDERQLFTDKTEEAESLKLQFRQHFANISRIMDCVGCDKCRLWGKLQTQGMGTALKILFTAPDPLIDCGPQCQTGFQLTRREIVALFNAIGRLSTSIGALPELC